MTRCPSCKGKLTPSRLCEFGAMVFIECVSCQIIWDYTTREEYIKKLSAKISRETKQYRSVKKLSRVPAVLAGS